jgi:hypothetical protein
MTNAQWQRGGLIFDPVTANGSSSPLDGTALWPDTADGPAWFADALKWGDGFGSPVDGDVTLTDDPGHPTDVPPQFGDSIGSLDIAWLGARVPLTPAPSVLGLTGLTSGLNEPLLATPFGEAFSLTGSVSGHAASPLTGVPPIAGVPPLPETPPVGTPPLPVIPPVGTPPLAPQLTGIPPGMLGLLANSPTPLVIDPPLGG